MTPLGWSFLAVAIVTTIAPYFLSSRERWPLQARVDCLFYAIAIAFWIVLPLAWVRLAPEMLYAVFLFVRVIILCVAASRGTTARSVKLGLVATLLYLSLLPNVLRFSIDGDEPFYLLLTESIVHDRDVDLRNQYATLEQSATRRTNLEPQFGDPVGPKGEQYSRHEPFLPILMIPGFLAFGLFGGVATIAIFGGLLVWSVSRLLEDEGVEDRVRLIVIAMVAFGPPVLFYATRIWPEVPAAFFFSEALRAQRRRSIPLLAGCLLALALLKIRFLAVAVPFMLLSLLSGSSKKVRTIAMAFAVAVVPLIVVALINPSIIQLRAIERLSATDPVAYYKGLFGLVLDGHAGFLFRAPFYLLAFGALLRWRSAPEVFRLGCLAALPYLLVLAPRAEWHGGWSPPLRYVVIFVPLLALGAAKTLERWFTSGFDGGRVGALCLLIGVTAMTVIHGIAWPWRLFHLANGENVAGEYLSRMYASDFSRLFPSFIRLNRAAVVASVVSIVLVLILFLLRRDRAGKMPALLLSPMLLTAVLIAGFVAGRQPGRVVELEDTHVIRSGGELYPEVWTVMRFMYRGGWKMRTGDEIQFAYAGGESRLHFRSPAGAVLSVGGKRVDLTATGIHFSEVTINAPPGRLTIRSRWGEVILDRIEPR